jgi:uncharacterized peroxidase-related enzyme
VTAKADAREVRAILEDYRTAPINARLRAALAFLEKLTLTPWEVVPRDIEPLRAAGLSDRAIEEAIHVCTVFSIIDRIADALAFEVPSPEESARVGFILKTFGYSTSSLPG